MDESIFTTVIHGPLVCVDAFVWLLPMVCWYGSDPSVTLFHGLLVRMAAFVRPYPWHESMRFYDRTHALK